VRRALAAGIAAVAALAASSAALAHHDDKDTTLYPGSTTFLLSRSLVGGIPNGPSRNPAISRDQRLARFAAFESDASDIVAGDVNNATDVFFIRRAQPYGNDGTPWHAGQAELASTGMGGQPANGRSYLPALDGDPKHLEPHCLAFVSDASNLVTGDTNGMPDAFIRDLVTGVITRVSVNSRGEQSNGPTFDVSLNGDCTRVAFTSTATNLALRRAPSNAPNLRRLVTTTARPGSKQVYVRILPGNAKDQSLVGETFLASAAQRHPGNGDSYDPDWSRSGKAFVFTSTATNLSSRDRTPNQDVYLRQAKRFFGKFRVTECGKKKCRRTVRGRQTLDLHTRLVSDGGNGDSLNASITDDTRRVAYESTSTNLDRRDGNRRFDIYRADMSKHPPAQLLISTTKRASGNGESHDAKITAGGIATFFDSTSSNLKIFPYFLDDPNGVSDVMVGIPIHDSSGVDSLTWENHFANGSSRNPAPSARHNYVLFESTASNIDHDVSNPLHEQAIFLRYDGPFSGDPVTEP
jgi:Tol biopolymer transport system component